MVVLINFELADAVSIFRITAVYARPLIENEPKSEVFIRWFPHLEIEDFKLW